MAPPANGACALPSAPLCPLSLQLVCCHVRDATVLLPSVDPDTYLFGVPRARKPGVLAAGARLGGACSSLQRPGWEAHAVPWVCVGGCMQRRGAPMGEVTLAAMGSKPRGWGSHWGPAGQKAQVGHVSPSWGAEGAGQRGPRTHHSSRGRGRWPAWPLGATHA